MRSLRFPSTKTTVDSGQVNSSAPLVVGSVGRTDAQRQLVCDHLSSATQECE